MASIEALISQLREGTKQERIDVLRALAHENDRSVLDAIIICIQQSKDGVIREEAVKALSQFDDRQATQILIAALQDTWQPVRFAAISALERRKTVEVAKALILLLEDNAIGIPQKAAAALAVLEDPAAIQPLIATLARFKDYFQEPIVKALVHFGVAALPQLIDGLKSKNPNVRTGILDILSHLGEPSIEPLIEALRSDDVPTRAGAALALGKIQDKRAVTPLIVLLRDAEDDVVVAAIDALVLLRDPLAFDAVLSLLHHPGSSIRAKVAWALRIWDDERAIPLLVGLLADTHKEVQEQVVYALKSFDAAAIPFLLPLLHSEDEPVYNSVVEILSALSESAAAQLFPALEDADWRVRCAITWTLAAIASADDEQHILSHLLAMLNDKDFRVRQTATAALSYFQGRLPQYSQGIVAALFEILTRPDEAVRVDAARELMNIESDEAVGAIMQALKHPMVATRLTTILSITEYVASYGEHPWDSSGWFKVYKDFSQVQVAPTVDPIVGALIELLHDENEGVREASQVALETMRGVLAQKRTTGTLDMVQGFLTEKVAPKLHLELQEETLIREALQKDAPDPRYTDIVFYYNDEERPDEVVPEGYALCVDQPYKVEVTIRSNTVGITSIGQTQRPLHDLRQEKPVTLLVVMEGDGVSVEEPVQTLLLPPSGDVLEGASFSIRPQSQSSSTNNLAELRVRIYYEFNLIEAIIICMEVVGKFDDPSQSQLDLTHPIAFKYERLISTYTDIEHIRPREMHIDVSRQGEYFLFRFLLRNEIGEKLAFTAPLRLLATDLEDALLNIRKILYDIALSETFTTQLEGDPDEFVASMQRLARAGSDLWTLLFKREPGSAIYEVGIWLINHPLKRDGIVQIHVQRDAGNFVFPWAFLYDAALPENSYVLPDLEGFWGVRYCIEQRLPIPAKGMEKVVRVEEKLSLGFMLWDLFRNAGAQKALMETLQAQSANRLEISSPPITDSQACYNLLRGSVAHILYFYTHGYTRHRNTDIGVGPDLELFLQRYEQLEKNSPLRKTYEFLYKSIKQDHYEKNRSWIELTRGKLYLEDLYRYIDRFLARPLVILNMCESAQVTLSLTDNFVHFFLHRGARAVIGTECPMTIEFAHPFAEKMLRDLLAGQDVGTTLLQARRAFLQVKNPLGLAYTLFGDATMRFEPPSIEFPDR